MTVLKVQKIGEIGLCIDMVHVTWIMFTAEVKDYILSAIQNRSKNKIFEWPNNVQIFPS